MSIFKKPNAGGFMDEIRCDEPSYIIWKWHPIGSQQGNNNRENAIRWGSSLRVKDGEVAVFVYKQNKGIYQDFIVGPYDGIIETANLPIISKIIGLAYAGGTPFQAEIYYINLAGVIQTKFAIPFFDIFDPRFTDFSVPVAVRGSINFRIGDYREFIKIHRLINFNINDFQNQIKDSVSRYVKNAVINDPAENNIPVIQIESRIAHINEQVQFEIRERLKNNFGVEVTAFDINSIEIDKSSETYVHLMAVTKELTSATLKAQTAANVKNIHDMQRIEAENYQESLRIQREESQYAQHKTTQSANFAAYQTEAQTSVGIEAAKALGKMGANGAGGVSIGGDGSGFNPAAMMAGMALGGAVGQNLVGNLNNAMSGVNPTSTNVPPPIPVKRYFIARDGQPIGPYDIHTMAQMAANGNLNTSDLVWTDGMPEWVKANDVEDIKAIFSSIPKPPPIPE